MFLFPGFLNSNNSSLIDGLKSKPIVLVSLSFTVATVLEVTIVILAVVGVKTYSTLTYLYNVRRMFYKGT